ncbi:MAG: phosphoglycolate phosphatase [Methanimicrococcus sp.]|nr:phosphoglycolate phosphatase [Methanimicrococcus sp.]
MKRFFGIVSDIDGTVTHDDRRLSAAALEAAHFLSGKVPIVLASGNTFCFTRTVSKLMGTRSPVIAENGGIILMSYDGAPIYIEPKMDEIHAALFHLKKHFDLTVFDSRERITDVAFAKTVDKEKILPLLSDFSNIHLVDAEFAYHLTDKNICKGDALCKTAKLMGLKPKDFVAVGDSDNDIDLFQTAGLSFAVANATSAVKKEADYVLKNKFGDGFSEMVEYLLSNDLLELENEKRNFYY